jgi:hypothetical protein
MLEAFGLSRLVLLLLGGTDIKVQRADVILNLATHLCKLEHTSLFSQKQSRKHITTLQIQ